MPVGRRHLLRLHRLLVRSAAGGHLVGVRGRVGVRVRVRARVRVRVRARVRVRIRIRVRVRVRIRVRVGVRVRVRVGVRVRAAGRHRGHPEPLFVPKVVEAIPRRLAIHRYTYMYMDSICYSYIYAHIRMRRGAMHTGAMYTGARHSILYIIHAPPGRCRARRRMASGPRPTSPDRRTWLGLGLGLGLGFGLGFGISGWG